jgi:hypothetical protein
MIDLDPKLAEILDQHTPPVDETGDWNHVLVDAGVVGHRSRANEKRRRRSWRPRRGPVMAVAVVATVCLVSVSLLSGDPSVVDRASAAVAIRADQVLHEKIVLSSNGYVLGSNEIWIEGAAPNRYRVVATPAGGKGRYEQGGTLDARSPTTDKYDPRTNTINRSTYGPTGTLSFDPASAIRNGLGSGKVHVEGARTMQGKSVIAIQLNSLITDSVGWGVRGEVGATATLLVDPRTYAPVQITFRHLYAVSLLGGISFTTTEWPDSPARLTLVERFKLFERLPNSPAALRLTSLRARHPGARCLIVSLLRPCR